MKKNRDPYHRCADEQVECRTSMYVVVTKPKDRDVACREFKVG